MLRKGALDAFSILKEVRMKKLALAVLLGMALVGRISVDVEPSRQSEFVRDFGSMLCQEMDCNLGEIKGLWSDKTLFFFWKCLDDDMSEKKKVEL